MADQISTIPKGWKMTTLGAIPNSWNIITAEKFCMTVTDGTHDTPSPTHDGEFLITSKHIKDGNIDLSSAYKISKEDFDEINKRSKVDQWDVLFSMIGTVGEVSLVNKKPNYAIKNIGLFKCGEEPKAKWLYYFLRGKIGQDEIHRRMSGTTQSYITLGDLRLFPVIIPSSEMELKVIAAVLSSLDDKIELLREQNKTLEATAQAIFKEWFVKFNFPNSEGKPYKASGGKMIDSELGDIPDGWRVGKLRNVGQIICGKTPSKENQKYFGGEIPFIKIPDMHEEVFIVKTEDSLTELGANTQKNKFIPKKSICVSCIATVGLVSITSKDSQTNQQINSIIPNNEQYLEYLYYVLTNIKSDLLAIGSGGSATLNINTSTFSNIEIVIPNKETLNNFYNTTNLIFTKILDNLHQIQTLSTLRDTLLPKLMKGEIRVKGFGE